MEEFNIHEVAEENNLDVISTTTGKNGYPQSVKYAITGFPNFSEAEKLAEKYGLRITTFWKKAGWQLYVRDAIRHSSRWAFQPKIMAMITWHSIQAVRNRFMKTK